MIHLRKRHAVLLCSLLALSFAAAQARADPGLIGEKQAEARQVLSQVQALDQQLQKSIEAYDQARWRLRQTQGRLRQNRRELVTARRQLARAETILGERAAAIYESGQPDATLELLLGARSLGQLLDEIDAVHRVSAADVAIVRQVRTYRARVVRERWQLQRAERSQASLSARLASEKASIEGSLAERRQLLSSIEGQIVRLKAEEAARQERLRREALARIAAQQEAARRAAEQRAAAERAAAQRAAAERAAAKQAAADKAAAERAATAKPAPAAPAATAAAEPATTAAAADPAPAPVPRSTEAAPTTTAEAPAPAQTEPATTEAAAAPPPPPPPPPTVDVTAATPEGASVAPPPSHGDVVGIAMHYLGVPYQWAGASPDTGFDCSGFVMYVYAQVGVSLPHTSEGQYGYGVPVSLDELAPGDLVFFEGLGHVGIYIGGGQFVHAPHTGDVVKISDMSSGYYAGSFVGARRL